METNHIYSESIIWMLADYSNATAYHFYPICLLIAASTWLYKAKSKAAIIALIGSTLVISTKILQVSVAKVSSVVLGSPVPHEDQNVVVWFVFLYGINIGLFVYGCALCWYFGRSKCV